MKNPPSSTKSPHLAPHLSARVEKLADVKSCTYGEALTYVVEQGFLRIDSSLEGFAMSEQAAELTSRQRAILNELRQGHAVKEIAARLCVSEVTVRTHILRIRERLGCPDLLTLRIPAPASIHSTCSDHLV